jgi:hypothetical protein
MINLIPPGAKKSITLEYWLRVFSVWGFIIAAALLVGTFIMVPDYVLINLQVTAFSDSAASAEQKLSTFKDVSKDLDTANQQAKVLIDGFRFVQLSQYAERLHRLENNEVSLTQIGIDRTKDGVAPIRLSGVAADRQALAAFRDRLLADPQVESVDLPISNLAKDKDITFNLTATIKKNAS